MKRCLIYFLLIPSRLPTRESIRLIKLDAKDKKKKKYTYIYTPEPVDIFVDIIVKGNLRPGSPRN